ncbi:MAG: hypothetical protein J0L61_09905 [Planctomycetes bacterium]|nr:hypothetical protein [Planctomycetota bacterium]
MSARAAAVLIALFALGAVAFCWFIMGPDGVEFAIVGLVIAVFSATIGIVAPLLGKKRGVTREPPAR